MPHAVRSKTDPDCPHSRDISRNPPNSGEWRDGPHNDGRKFTHPRDCRDCRACLVRIGVVFALLAASTLIVYFEGGLVDSHTGRHPELLDCVYFVLITITTVGYGDIVPVDTPSRLVDALVLTPIRFIVLLIFVGTAYQLSIKQFQEEQRMKRAVSKLNDHTIVCGYGTTGQAAVRELLLHGTRPDQIVVVDVDENALRATSGLEVVAIQADAAQESTLNAIAIQRPLMFSFAPAVTTPPCSRP